MAYRSLEDLLKTLKSDFQTYLPDELNIEEAEHADDPITILAPSENSYFIVNNIDTIPELHLLPAIVLMGWNEVVVTPGEQKWDIWQADVAVRIYMSGFADQEVLNKALYRLSNSTFRIIRKNFQDEEDVDDVEECRIDYSAVPPVEPLFQASEITFKVKYVRGYE